MAKKSRPFLTARWLDLLMINYEVDPVLLRPLVPAGTQLDTWRGRTRMSVVAFHFRDTRVRGLPIPLHRHFEELNLRFYVRRESGGELRRGVVFIKEVVPRWAIARIARQLYNENYAALPMHHDNWTAPPAARHFSYQWLTGHRLNRLAATARGEPVTPADDSEEAFITEHYWGYVRQRNGSTLQYQVEHPRWRVWRADTLTVDTDWSALYDAPLCEALAARPTSVLVAEGSEVTVRRGVRIS